MLNRLSRCAKCARRSYSTSQFTDIVSNAELQRALSEYNDQMSRLRQQYLKEATELGAAGPPKPRAKEDETIKKVKQAKERKKRNVQSIGSAPKVEIPTRTPRQTIPKHRPEARLQDAVAREERLHHLTNLFHRAGGSATSETYEQSIRRNINMSVSQQSGRHALGFVTNYKELEDRISTEFGKDGEQLPYQQPLREGAATSFRATVFTNSHLLAEKMYGVHPADAANEVLGDTKHLAKERLETTREWLEGSAHGYDQKGIRTRAIGVRALLGDKEKPTEPQEENKDKS